MKNENLDVKLIWIQFEDHLVPQLRLNIVDRAVYSHLFRHSRLVGKRRLRFSIAWLGRGTRRVPSEKTEREVPAELRLFVVLFFQESPGGRVAGCSTLRFSGCGF
jgi:hypothetical protein